VIEVCATHYAEWVEGTADPTRTDGPAREGSTYHEVNPILGPWKARTSRRSLGNLASLAAR
jgi:hypothetical protein